jgi:hypothetical protein
VVLESAYRFRQAVIASTSLKTIKQKLAPCHWSAGEIKRHPEVETLLVTGDSRAKVMRKVLNWPTEVQETSRPVPHVIASTYKVRGNLLSLVFLSLDGRGFR